MAAKNFTNRYVGHLGTGTSHAQDENEPIIRIEQTYARNRSKLLPHWGAGAKKCSIKSKSKFVIG
jgi:hypothetical protein